MKSLLKRILFTLLAVVPRDRKRASILMYHSVGKNGAEFTVPEVAFKQQLQYLFANRYQLLSMSALVQRVQTHESLDSCVALTFDDGYRDMYDIVFPLIKELRVPISIFIPTDFIGSEFSTSAGDTLPILDWKQIREMHESGLVEFLPHGRMHYSLPTLSSDEAKEEMVTSLADLEGKLGTVPRIYAYAKGKYSSETIRILESERFVAAVTVRPGYISSKSSLFELPRNHMDSMTSFAEFKSRVRGSGDWYETLKGKV